MKRSDMCGLEGDMEKGRHGIIDRLRAVVKFSMKQ